MRRELWREGARVQLGLLLGDAAALIAFVLLGQRAHGVADAEGALWRAGVQVIALGLPYALLGALLGAYPSALPRTGMAWLALAARAGIAALFAVPLGLFMRAAWLGQSGVPLLFAAVALPLGTVFVGGWRLMLAVGVRLRASRAAPLRPSATAPRT